jgi:Ser/Thr protein kinase RdoA (MazF antagonist)
MRERSFGAELIAAHVLPHFFGPRERGTPDGSGAPALRITPVPGGLINRTFLVSSVSSVASSGGSAGATDFILQWVNPLFPAAVHGNIAAVTAALVRAGVTTPELVPTLDGEPCLVLAAPAADEPASVWRLMSRVPGVSFDVVSSPAQAFAAARLVARFHAALTHLEHAFAGRRASVHDTPRHLAHLRDVLAFHADHRLFSPVQELAAELLATAPRLPALPGLPEQIGHGDLKLNNFLFAGEQPPRSEDAVCLVDLDTVGPIQLAHEWGDAWRSWCNRSGEDEVEAELDLSIFAAAWEGYRQHVGRDLSPEERRALLLAPEWISLELAARFAGDALAETYFGWSPARFAGRGEHNLVRARGQWSLHRAFTATRPDRARLLEVEGP